MIELRWLERLVYPEWKGPTSAGLPYWETALQYRETMQPGDSGEQEWQDVKKVKQSI